MIDVDERGRSAAADLNRAARGIAGTDEVLVSMLGGAAVAVVGQSRRPRRLPLAVGLGVAAASVLLVVALVNRSGERGVEIAPATLPATSSPIVTPPPTTIAAASAQPTSAAPTFVPTSVPTPSTGQTPATAAPPDATHPLLSVDRAADLPAVVTATGPLPPFEVGIAGGPTLENYAALLAVQAPDGRLVIDNAGDGGDLIVDPATGQDAWLEDGPDGKRVVSIGDVATVSGVPTLLAVRGYPCNTEGADCGGLEPTLVVLDGSRPSEVVIGVGGTTSRTGERIESVGGRFSLSDTGLVAGVVQLADSANVAFLLDSTVAPDSDGPSRTALGATLGLNGVATSDPTRRIDAATVDQSGSAVAWLDAAGITVVALGSGERRVIPLAARPTNPLPVLDLALAGGSIADGAVLLSAPGEPGWVVDLTDGSVTQVPDFIGTLTFSAVPPP